MSVRIAMVIAAATLLALFVADNLKVTTSITSLLPAAHSDGGQISHALAHAAITRSVAITVGGALETTLPAAQLLERELKQSDAFAWVQGGIDPNMGKAIHALYFPRRYGFLADHPAALRDALAKRGLDERLQRLRGLLARPDGFVARSLAAEDPLLAFTDQLARIRDDTTAELSTQQGRFFTRDGAHAVVFAATRADAFAGDAQQRVQEAMQRAAARVTTIYPGARLEASCIGRFAVASQKAIQRDIARVSTLSLALLVALFAALFRSLRLLLLGALPLLLGFLVATATCLLIAHEIHGLTLAFGATLIGVCIDYPVHLFNHMLCGPRPPLAAARSVRPGLLIGCGTTVAGLLGFAWADLEGLREMAWFAAVATAVALIVTLSVLPRLASTQSATPAVQALSQSLARVALRLRRRRRLLWLAPLAAVGAMALWLPQITWNDQLRSLSTLDPQLQAEENRVRRRLAGTDGGHIVVANAADEQHALAINDAVDGILRQARDAGELQSWSSLHALLWAADRQQASWRAVAAADLPARLPPQLARLGFAPAAFAPFFAHLRGAAPTPLTPSDLRQSPLRHTLALHSLDLGDQIAWVTFLRGVARPHALAARLKALPGARIFEQRKFLLQAYQHLRQRIQQLLGVGLLFVLAVLAARYRQGRKIAMALLPSLLAAGVAAACLTACGTALNLLHVMAALLVLSIGVDYGVFLLESGPPTAQSGPTLLSLAVSGLSTVFSFGLLGTSASPALASIGQMVGVGVFVAALLAPICWAIGHAEKNPPCAP